MSADRRGWFALLVLLVGPLAHAEGRMRAVVRIIGDDDRAVAQRITGQVADLDVDVDPANADALEPDVAAQLTAADALATDHRARVVVWFGHSAAALLVFVSEPTSGRVLVRRLASEKVASSATLEAAALVVRTALRALAEGGVIGVERTTLVPTPTPSPSPTPSPIPIPSQTPTPTPRPFFALGWSATIDGAADAGAHAILLAGGIEYGALATHLELSSGFPTDIHDSFATIRLWRNSATVLGALRFVHTGPVDLGIEAGIGPMVWVRYTLDASSGTSAAPSSTQWSLLVDARLAMRIRPWAREPWRIAFGAGITGYSTPIQSGYEVGGQFVAAVSPWPVEPRFFATVEWSPPR